MTNKIIDTSAAIGIDLGGTNIKYALINRNGDVVKESLRATEVEKGRNGVIDNLRLCISELNDFAKDQNLNVVGVGVGTPGIIDVGLVLGGAENLPEWESLPLGGILGRGYDFPIFVDNDANLMGLGEVRFGAKKNLDDVIFITVGTGVGGAMVLNGKLYGGHRNRGAELGHVIVNPDGEKCSCGEIGCLEAHASVTALIRDYKSLCSEKQISKNKIDGKFIVGKYLKKEREAITAMNIHFDYLSSGIASFINIFSPQMIVIGGGIAEAGDFYIDELKKRATQKAMKETRIFTKITKAKLGNQAGFFGAAALVFDKVKIQTTSSVLIK